MEEYSIAAHLPQSSLAELARNSVPQSGFETEIKRRWLSELWLLPGAKGNNFETQCKTNVPDIRLEYWDQTLQEEKQFIRSGSFEPKLETWNFA